MKRIFTLIVLLFITGYSATAQGLDLVNDDFNYTAGSLTTANANWVAFSGAGSSPVTVASPGLTYTGYWSSGSTNKITIASQATTTSQEDVYREFEAMTANTVYVSFLLNLTDVSNLNPNTSTTGNYFFALLPNSSTSNYVSRMVVRLGTVATKYQLGIRPGSGSTVTWGADMDPGTTYLVVLRYTFVSGTANDVVDVWINPTLGATPPAATFSSSDWTGSTEPPNIARIALRQAGGAAASTPSASLDGFRVGTNWTNAPLPVTLLSFGAQASGKEVSINWVTTNESGLKHYEVEKSVNGRDFKPVAVTEALNRTATHTYTAIDANLVAGVSYYRLKIINTDGSYTYSKIATVKTKVFDLGVYPNPVKTDLTVQHEEADVAAVITVINLNGKTAMSVPVQSGAVQTNINTTMLAPGSYTLVYINNGVRQTRQFIKQ